MRLHEAGQRPQRRRGGVFAALPLSLLLAGGLAFCAPRPARAQDTTAVKRDTARVAADTGAARPDTSRAAADTVPPPLLPSMPTPARTGWGAGVWLWRRDDLLLTGAVTLGDLLERIPGVTTIRSGWYGQPEAVSSLGETAGRIEIYLDGYQLEPLTSGVPDLSRLPLVGIESVRVERRLDVLRVDLQSTAPATPQSYARIEAAVGVPNTKLFRGIFLTPHFLLGPFSGGIERLDTDGTHRNEPVNWFEGWAKWGILRKGRGIEAELRRGHFERTDGVPWVGTLDRTDWTIRARDELRPGLVAELYTGATSVTEPPLPPDTTLPPDTALLPDSTLAVDTAALDTFPIERSDRQSGAWLAWAGERGWARAELRLHTSDVLPKSELDLGGGISPVRLLSVSGTVDRADWRGRSAVSSDLHGEVGPFAGIRAVAEYASGDRGIPAAADTAGLARFSHRTALRVGGELAWHGIAAGAAYVTLQEDSVPGFGLPFDRRLGPVVAGKLSGWEGHAFVPLFGTPFYLDGSFTNWTSGFLALYTPQRSWRAALAYHGEPLPSGHLEILARAEYRSRGLMNVPQADSIPVVQVPEVNALDFYLQIRILDLRAFVRYEDAMHSKGVYDIPDTEIPGPRMVYGIKWQFFN